jgi:cytochrome c55X
LAGVGAPGWLGIAAWLPVAALAQSGDGVPSASRQAELVHIVRQDCGACHGMRLTGGLGPALTREALAERSVGTIEATILHGRPGTPMPPWRALLPPNDVHWIAEQLAAGFAPQVQGRR